MKEVKFKANLKDLESLRQTVNEIEEAVDAIPVPTVSDDGSSWALHLTNQERHRPLSMS